MTMAETEAGTDCVEAMVAMDTEASMAMDVESAPDKVSMVEAHATVVEMVAVWRVLSVATEEIRARAVPALLMVMARDGNEVMAKAKGRAVIEVPTLPRLAVVVGEAGKGGGLAREGQEAHYV